MSKIKNEAFMDLESGVTGQLLPLWNKQWGSAGAAIGTAAEEARWDDAHSLVESVSFAKVLEKKPKLLQTVGMAALLLGASRFGEKVKDTSIYNDPPKDWLDSSVEQMGLMLGENATTAMRQELHLILDRFEYAASASNGATLDDMVVSKAVKGKDKYVPVTVRNQRTVAAVVQNAGLSRGASYVGLAANLHVSRMSSAGFLLESRARGQTRYQISEVMDKRTCPVCARMHGMSFTVADGLDHLAKVFTVKDPTQLAQVAPWPRQTKAGLNSFLNLNSAGLLDAGFHLPPYHPGCRGIIVPVETIQVVTVDEAVAAAVAGIMAPDVIADRLMGNRADLDSTSSILFGNGAVSALYSVPGYTPPAASEPVKLPSINILDALLTGAATNFGDDDDGEGRIGLPDLDG